MSLTLGLCYRQIHGILQARYNSLGNGIHFRWEFYLENLQTAVRLRGNFDPRNDPAIERTTVESCVAGASISTDCCGPEGQSDRIRWRQGVALVPDSQPQRCNERWAVRFVRPASLVPRIGNRSLDE